MEYGTALQEAWRVTWRHESLWLLGVLFATIGLLAVTVIVAAKAVATTFFSAYWTVAWRRLEALRPEHVRVSH